MLVKEKSRVLFEKIGNPVDATAICTVGEKLLSR